MLLRRLHNLSTAPVSSQWQAPEPSVSMYYPPIAPSAKCILCIFIEYRTGGISRGISRKYNVEEKKKYFEDDSKKTNMISVLDSCSLQRVIPKGLLRLIFLLLVAFWRRGPFHPNLIPLVVAPIQPFIRIK